MKVIIAGSRTFTNYPLLFKKCSEMLSRHTDIEIVCGMAQGADKLGGMFATEKGYPIKEFPADWDRYGKSAGYKRNVQMAEYADALIAFWDGKSAGTKHMIDIVHQYGIKVRVFEYAIM